MRQEDNNVIKNEKTGILLLDMQIEVDESLSEIAKTFKSFITTKSEAIDSKFRFCMDETLDEENINHMKTHEDLIE